MKKWWGKGIIVCVLMGSAIGINAQSIVDFKENSYSYDTVQVESQQEISELLAEEAAFKLDITIPYLGNNGYIQYVGLSKYSEEGESGTHYWGGQDLNKEIPAGNYYVQIIARDDENYYIFFTKTNNGVIALDDMDFFTTTIYNDSSLDLRSVMFGANRTIYNAGTKVADFEDMKSKAFIKVVSIKETVQSVGVNLTDDSGVRYGLGKQINGISEDNEIRFGEVKDAYCKNVEKNTYLPGSKGNLYIYGEDGYGNKLSNLDYKNEAVEVATLTLSKENYVETQLITKMIYGFDFNVPNEVGQYQFKIEFNKNLPIPIPSIEGQLYVGEKQQAPEETPEESTGVHNFVTNLYRYCMDREPDEAGLNSWTQQLQNKQITAADTLKLFLNSSEFQNKQTSNQTYIDILYKVCMGRSGDADGISYWNSILKSGESRNNLLVSFVDSTEFEEICSSYGVMKGNLIPEIVDKKTEQIKAFITRFYNNCLGRAPEQEGLEYWTKGLKEGYLTGAELGRSFVTSTEMTNKNLSTEDYLGVLYDTFMGRSADESGKQYWMQCIEAGTTKEQVMTSFIESMEFSLICEDYGIQVGL